MGSEIARYRIDDLIRDAESYRRSKGARVARAAARRQRAQRVAAGIASVLLWPIRQ